MNGARAIGAMTIGPPILHSPQLAAFLIGMLWLGEALAASEVPAEQSPLADYAELERMMSERMGKAPLRDQPVTSDGVQVVFQTGHAFGITAVALSRDGRYILSGAQDETVRLWSVASGQEVRTLTGFDMGGPRLVAFSADGARMILADMKGLSVLDVMTGEKLRAFKGLSMYPMVSGDGRVGVDGGNQGVAGSPSLVDLATGAVVWRVPVDGVSESAVALSGDGSTLLTRVAEQTRRHSFARKRPETTAELHVWDVSTRKIRSKLNLPDDGTDNFNAMALSPDGKQLLIANRNHSLSLYDLATSRETVNIPTGMAATAGMTTAMLFSPDGKKIAYATNGGRAKIWEIPSGNLVTSVEASTLSFSSNGETIVLGRNAGGAPLLHDLRSSRETKLAGGAEAILDLAVTGDGRSVIAAMMGGGVKLWGVDTAQMIRSFNCPSGTAASSVSASKTTQSVAVGCMDGSVALWDLTSGRKIRDLLPPLAGQFASALVRFSRDDRLLAVAVQDVLSLFDAASGQLAHQVKLPATAEPQMLASSRATMTPEMMKQLPARVRKDLEAEQAAQPEASDDPSTRQDLNSILAIDIHPDGRLIAFGRTYEIALWDVETGKALRHLGGAGATSAAPMPGMAGGMPGGASMEEMMKQLLSGKTPMVTATNPLEMLQGAIGSAKSQFDGASSLAFSPDGRTLLSVGSQGRRLWDVATGQQVRTGPAPTLDPNDPKAMMDLMLGEEMGGAGGTAFSPDGRVVAYGIGRIVKIVETATGRPLTQLVGHTSNVSAIAFIDGGRMLVSGGLDGAVRVWTLPDGKEAAALIALGQSDYVAVTPDQYYRASRSGIKGIAFRVGGQLYPFEQFDLRFNRPDILLQRLGLAAPEVVQSYRHAYERRLRKMGFSETTLGRDFHLPEVTILTKELPLSFADASLTLLVRATDDKYPLDRLNVFVNDVPVYGTAGLALAAKGAQRVEQQIEAPLVAGRNKVQVSVLNAQGTESLKQTVYVNTTADPGPTDVYVVAIGVSEYKNSAYNLRYAAKDAGDFLSAYRAVAERPAPHGQVHVLDITNGKATREGIRKSKDFLKQARVHDLVVVFAAGHGMTDAKQNYYFGTWDIDPGQPELNGLPYDDFEGLLDGIPALQKLLLIDTCFSGEIDRDEQTVVAQAESGDGTVKMRAFKAQRGISVVADNGGSVAAQTHPDVVRFQQDWFADLRRGTGAVVISSASGNEYALEGEQWRNGVFTYALLNGLKNLAADTNKDGVVAVGELQGYVIEQVRDLTNGGQNPTVRRENLDYDFAVY